jgi:hypothetical protein
MTHAEIVKRFANRQINSRKKEINWKAGNLSCDQHFIYSYHWYIMAKCLGDKNGKDMFLKNGDVYSPSTSQHLALIQELCPGPVGGINYIRIHFLFKND